MYTEQWREFLKQELELIKESGRFKDEAVFLTSQDINVKVKKGGRIYECLNFCANNYLGLANNEELITAASQAMAKWGYGMASVRFICGTQQIHKDLERKIAEFLGVEDAIVYTSCFDANAGLFEALLKTEKSAEEEIIGRMVILSDQLNHASIIDGVRLAKGEKRRCFHADMEALEKHLREMEAVSKQLKIIATDGVFSMDGDIAKLPEICDLAEKWKAMVMVDDSHATGFLGERGRGSVEHCGVMGRVDIITSTFGKALGGGIGGFTAGPKEVIEILRQRSRPYLFSNSLLPSACGSALKVFDILENSSVLRQKLMVNTAYFRKAIQSFGFETKGDIHPIVPVMIRNSKLAQEMAQRLLENGVLAVAFSFPVVPKNEDRIRVQISAAHEKHHLDFALEKFYRVGKKLKII